MAAGPGRNDPCPCGSGRKTKRCCGERRGPSEDQLARARLAALGRQAIDDLLDLSDRTLDRLEENLWRLPELDLSLHAKPPELSEPEQKRLRQAMAADRHDDAASDTVIAAADRLDTPQQRARMADALLQLRDRGWISHAQTAFALYDLSRSSSRLMIASAIYALGTHFGGDATPAGLLVAA
jgi:hypothetical protein